MHKVTVKNKKGDVLSVAKVENPSAYISSIVALNVFGKPERWCKDSNEYSRSDILELKDIFKKELDGSRTHELWVRLKAEYIIESIDVTYEHNLNLCIESRKKEYPSLEEFMHTYFDGGKKGLDALKEKRKKVKAKYPKPNANIT